MRDFEVTVTLIDLKGDGDATLVMLFEAKDHEDAARRADLIVDQGRFKMRIKKVEEVR